MLQDTNRPAEAESLMRRAVLIFERSERDTGHRYPHYEQALANLAVLQAEIRGDGAAPQAGVRPSGSGSPSRVPPSSRRPRAIHEHHLAGPRVTGRGGPSAPRLCVSFHHPGLTPTQIKATFLNWML